jgi:hypothetical protein
VTFPTIPTTAGNSILQTSQATATTTHTFPSLTTLAPAAGDLLIAIIVTYAGGSTNAEFSAWGGSFTEFVDQAGNSASIQSIGAAYKFSDGTETGTFTVTTVASSRSAMFLMQIPLAHATTPPEATAKSNGTTVLVSATAQSPSWGADDTLWIAVAVNGETSLTGTFTDITAAPASYTNMFQVLAVGGDVIGAIGGAVAFRQLNTATEDQGTWTLDVGAASHSVLAIAVRPATAPIGLPSLVMPTRRAP